jgi:hypothetical protein
MTDNPHRSTAPVSSASRVMPAWEWSARARSRDAQAPGGLSAVA